MKKIVLGLILLFCCSNLGLAQKLPTRQGEICDVRFMDGKWKKYIIFEFREDGIVGIEYDVDSQKHFVDRDDIEKILCAWGYYEFPEIKEEQKESRRIFGYMERRRDPTLAGILSFIFIGGGQFYNDQEGKGMLLILSQFAVAAVVFSNEPAILKPMDNPGVAVVMLSIIPFVSLMDAVSSANKINADLKLRYNISFQPDNNRLFCGLTLNF